MRLFLLENATSRWRARIGRPCLLSQVLPGLGSTCAATLSGPESRVSCLDPNTSPHDQIISKDIGFVFEVLANSDLRAHCAAGTQPCFLDSLGLCWKWLTPVKRWVCLTTDGGGAAPQFLLLLSQITTPVVAGNNINV